MVIGLGENPFLPNPLQFTIHPTVHLSVRGR